MGRYVRGDVLYTHFPYGDGKTSKKRPTVLLADPGGDKVIVCMITTKIKGAQHTVPVDNRDMASGVFDRPPCEANYSMLASIDRSRIERIIGRLDNGPVKCIQEGLRTLFLK